MTIRCVDTSAWHHAARASVAHSWRRLLEADELGLCDQVRLEVLYSARSGPDYESLLDELGALHVIAIGPEVFPRALEVQRQLAHVGGLHHRSVKIAELVIAAAAELCGAVVWHYDGDFDRIAEITGQPTEWIAPRGSL